MTRHSRLTACAVVTLCAFLGACGEPQQAADDPTSTTTPTRTSTSSTTPTVPTGGETETSPPQQDNRCTAAMLEGMVQPGDAGAGNRYATLMVTNTSGAECTLWGYGGLELVDAAGNPTPTDVTRQANPGPTLVRLPPGATAAKNLHWGVVPTGDEPVDGPCQPESAGVRVIPPDETEPFAVNFNFGSVCANGHIDTSAYYPN